MKSVSTSFAFCPWAENRKRPLHTQRIADLPVHATSVETFGHARRTPPSRRTLRISPDGREALDAIIQQAVSQALEKLGLKPKRPLHTDEAADYIGVGRSSFYALMKEDPSLHAASFTVGRSACGFLRLRRVDGSATFRDVGVPQRSAAYTQRADWGGSMMAARKPTPTTRWLRTG